MFLKEAFEMTDFVNKFNTGMENINAMSMNPTTKATCLKAWKRLIWLKFLASAVLHAGKNIHFLFKKVIFSKKP